jgi:hypothetical protein
LTINANGEFTRIVGNCTMRGKLTPSATKKGFAQLSASAAGCEAIKNDVAFQGVGWMDAFGTIHLSAFDTANENGFVVVGGKLLP